MIDKSKTIIIDTETTGLKKSQVLQMAIIDANGNVLFNELIKPRGIKSWSQAEKIHHITFEMVEHKRTFKHYQKEIQRIINNATTIIGYNVNFDLDIISKYITIDYEHQNIIDVMPMFAEVYNEIHPIYKTYKWQSLTKATKYYGYDWTSHGKPHGALADIYATLFVYEMINEHGTLTFDNIPMVYVDVINNWWQSIAPQDKQANPITYKFLNDYLQSNVQDQDKANLKKLYNDLLPLLDNAPFEIKLICKRLENIPTLENK